MDYSYSKGSEHAILFIDRIIGSRFYFRILINMSTIPKTEFVTTGTNCDKNDDENNDKKVTPANRYSCYDD